jgi:hypothetical protein
MFGYIPLTVCAILLLWLLKMGLSLRHNVAIAKGSGLPYAISREFRINFSYLVASSLILSQL